MTRDETQALLERLKAYAKDVELTAYYSNSPPMRPLPAADLSAAIGLIEKQGELLRKSAALNAMAGDFITTNWTTNGAIDDDAAQLATKLFGSVDSALEALHGETE